MNRLYLVRHGENPANITKELSSRLVDYSLTEKGRLQARQTADFFLDKNIDEIYASPLKRAIETAEIIGAALKLPVTPMENFREIDVGEMEGLPVSAELWKTHNEIILSWYRGTPENSFPGGDNHFTLWERMRSGLVQILDGKQNRNIILVAHVGIFTFTINKICPEVHPLDLIRGTNPNCSISELLVELNGDQISGQLVSWGNYSHLHGEAAAIVSGVPRAGELK